MSKRKMEEKGHRNVALEDQLAADAAPRRRDRKKAKMPGDDAAQDLSVITLAKKDVKLAAEMISDSDSDTAEVPGGTRKSKFLSLSNEDSGDDSDQSDDRSYVPLDYEDNTHEILEELQLSQQDTDIMNSLASDAELRTSLAEAMRKKFEEKLNAALKTGENTEKTGLDPRIVKLYRGVGEVLTKYRSGRLPKAFKIVPSLSNWETVLWIMEPDKWTAAAVYEGTRLFASNLNEKMAQRYYNLVLLPRLRDEIAEYKKLSPHLYQALMKSVFKPAAFFKGMLIPLCEDPECSLREAVVFGSTISKISIPMLHSAAAMLRLAQLPGYNGPALIILHILLKKKYVLPYRVVDELVNYFLQFGEKDDSLPDPLPVLWHQCLLSFVSVYARDMTASQHTLLLNLTKCQHHQSISPEIRTTINSSKVTREEGSRNMNSIPNSRTVSISMD